MCMTYIYRCTNCNETVESVVELDECPQCGFDACWDTWKEIQIIEKNKNREKKTQGWQDKVIEPRNKMTKESIIKKVEKLEEKNRYIQRCLKVRVCPNCGCNISKNTVIDLFFTCCACGFSK